MSESIYLFNKPREQRLEEFQDILCSRQPPVLPSQVADEWSYSLQQFLEPGGWQALWKISRQICEELGIVFPKFVLVTVQSIDFQELTAYVNVDGVQYDISIPPKQEVPLMQLFPTKKQENTCLNVDFTANFIDQLRFFYNHLWFSWDLEESDCDWPRRYLEPRLQMYFDMSDGKIPAKLADKIHNYREKARKLYEEKQDLEKLLHNCDGDTSIEDSSSTKFTELTYKLMQLHIKLNPLINEIQLLENTSLRTLVIKQFLKEEEEKQSSSVIVVWQGGSLDSFMNFLSTAKKVCSSETNVLSKPSLHEAVECAVHGNTILLHDGTHCVNLCLEYSLSILGVGRITELYRKVSNSYLLSARNAIVRIENIKLNAADVLNIFQVLKNATVELVNCDIYNGQSMDGRGIVVNCGGRVFVDKCRFSRLNVAISCYPGSHVSIQNSDVQDCAIGIEAYEDSNLLINESKISNCKRAALHVTQRCGTHKKENIQCLKKFQGIKVSNLNLVRNGSDVELNSEPNLNVA